MTKDRILEKEEFIQQYVLARAGRKDQIINSASLIGAATVAWNAIRKECDECN